MGEGMPAENVWACQSSAVGRRCNEKQNAHAQWGWFCGRLTLLCTGGEDHQLTGKVEIGGRGIAFLNSVTSLLSWRHEELFALHQLQTLSILSLSFCRVPSAGFFFLAKVMVNLVENGIVVALETPDSLHNSGNALPWGWLLCSYFWAEETYFHTPLFSF